MSQHAQVGLVNHSSQSLGIASIVLGAISCLVLFLPAATSHAMSGAIFAFVLTLVGMVLGGIGLFQTISRHGDGIGYSIGGLTLNGIPAVLCLLLIWSIHHTNREIAERQRIEAAMEKERQTRAMEDADRHAKEKIRLELARGLQIEQERMKAEAEARKKEAEARVLAEENTKQAGIDRKRREAEEAAAQRLQLEKDKEKAAQEAVEKRENAAKRSLENGKLLSIYIRAHGEKPPQSIEEIFPSMPKKSKLELVDRLDPWGNSYQVGMRASSIKGKAIYYIYTLDPDTKAEITTDPGTVGLANPAETYKALKDVSELSSPLWEFMAQNNKKPPQSIDELKPFIKEKERNLNDPWGKKYRIGTQRIKSGAIMHYVYTMHPDGQTQLQGIGAQGTNSED